MKWKGREKEYQKEYNKKWYEDNKDKEWFKKRRIKNVLLYKEKNPEKIHAKNLLHSAIRWKGFKKGAECEICRATEKIQAHHEDYSKPLEVVWLCPCCHTNLHRLRDK